jgi:hypothetical protein
MRKKTIVDNREELKMEELENGSIHHMPTKRQETNNYLSNY